MKKLKADSISMDRNNGDGVFLARDKKTQQWGMYQYSGTEVSELIPMQYDSMRNFPFNGNFTAVYNNGKAGFYLSYWSYSDKAKQSVPCLYEDYQRHTITWKKYNTLTYLAVKKNGKWGWVDWLTGEEKTEFIYETKKDLPYPAWEQKY